MTEEDNLNAAVDTEFNIELILFLLLVFFKEKFCILFSNFSNL